MVLNKAIKTANNRLSNGLRLIKFSNWQIFKNDENKELKKNYMGVYSMEKIMRYINFYEIIKRKNGKYPFAIFNADNNNQPGKH